MFIPLMKADAAQRLVSGYLDETPDRAGEIMDYATAKGAFQDWSAEMEKASGGKSLGNIRGQHSNIAAGKLVELTFDDDLKKVFVVAKIVDDNEWQKVEEGVYTGFSPGGRYAKRWPDGKHKRYTPLVKELSIVDVPCKPESTFLFTKADGTEEERHFILDRAYEPGNEATIERADELAKAAGKPGKGKDFVVKARAELIAENADEALAKMAGADDQPEPVAVEPEPAADPLAALEAAMEKADGALASTVPASEIPEPFRDLVKAAEAVALIGLPADTAAANPALAKSLWSTEWLNRLLREFACLQSEVTWDEKISNSEDMAIPTKAAEIVKMIGELLIQMTQEGVADLLTNIENSGVEIDTVVIEGDVIVMELANQIVDLVKADTTLMEKAGARNSKSDAATIQSVHDGAVSLGATCSAEANKDALATLQADHDRLAKAVPAATLKIEELTGTVEEQRTAIADRDDQLAKAAARVAELEALPAPPKGNVFAVDKENDGKPLAKSDTAPDKRPLRQRLADLPPGPQRAQELLKATR